MLESGFVVTIPFPFSEKEKSKPRPVLVISRQDGYGDFICLAVTSREREMHAVPLTQGGTMEGRLPVSSWIRTDKVFTLNACMVIKVIGAVRTEVVRSALDQLCQQVGHS